MESSFSIWNKNNFEDLPPFTSLVDFIVFEFQLDSFGMYLNFIFIWVGSVFANG